MRLIVLAIAMLISITSFAQTKQKPFIADGIYSVSFGSSKPKIIRDTLQGQTGNTDRTTYVVEQGHSMRLLGTLAPQGRMASQEGDTYFDSMIESIQSGMPGMKFVVNRPTTIGAYNGREIEATNSQVTVVARMFVTKKGLVHAQAVFPNSSTAGRASASAFLKSLAIVPGQ